LASCDGQQTTEKNIKYNNQQKNIYYDKQTIDKHRLSVSTSQESKESKARALLAYIHCPAT